MACECQLTRALIRGNNADKTKAPRDENASATLVRRSPRGLGDNDDVKNGSKNAQSKVRMDTYMKQPSQRIALFELLVGMVSQNVSSKWNRVYEKYLKFIVVGYIKWFNYDLIGTFTNHELSIWIKEQVGNMH